MWELQYFSNAPSITMISSRYMFVVAGESNSGDPDLYSCQFPAMIEDWRKAFHAGTDGENDPMFPFGFVQVFLNRQLAWTLEPKKLGSTR